MDRYAKCRMLTECKQTFVLRPRPDTGLGLWTGATRYLRHLRLRRSSVEEPLVALPSSFCLPLPSLVHRFFWGFGGVRRMFSSPIYRRTARQATPVSGGADDVEDAVEVARKPATIAPPFDELDQAPLPEEVQVALDRTDGAPQRGGQGLHLRPAQARLIVRVVGQRAVGRDDLRGHAGRDEFVNLWDLGESCRHRRLPT